MNGGLYFTELIVASDTFLVCPEFFSNSDEARCPFNHQRTQQEALKDMRGRTTKRMLRLANQNREGLATISGAQGQTQDAALHAILNMPVSLIAPPRGFPSFTRTASLQRSWQWQ